MGLRLIMILTVAGGFILSSLISLTVHFNVLEPVFLEYEKEIAAKTNQRPRSVLRYQTDMLGKICHDWASWDDAWRFMQFQDSQFVRANLSVTTLNNIGLTSIAFINDKGHIVWGTELDPKAGTWFGFEDSTAQRVIGILKSSNERAASGLLEHKKQPWFFAVRPILKSNETGPPRGWLIMGKCLDDELLEEMREISQVRFTTALLNPSETAKSTDIEHTVKKDSLYTRGILPDLAGKHAFYLETRTERTFLRFGKRQSDAVLTVNIVSGLLVVLLVVYILNRAVSRPLLRFIRQVQTVNQEGLYSTRFTLKGCSEMSDLGRIVNALLARVDHETRELSLLSETDSLTGLANRRSFDETFSRVWGEEASRNRELSLLIIDVDFFKKYNDSCGHLAGDRCLRLVADSIARNGLYQGDFPARYGGEEFVMLLPGTQLSGALCVAERIRSDIESQMLTHPAADLGYVTVSIGVSSVFPSAGSSPERLLARADAALYHAKEHGRNRSEAAAEV